MKIPKEVLEAAKPLLSDISFVEYLGKFKGNDAYILNYTIPVCTGFPFVYLYKNNKVKTVSGFDSLDIIDSFAEDIDESTIK